MAAQLQTTRPCGSSLVEAAIFQLLVAINNEAQGFRDGQLLGIVIVVAKAGRFRGIRSGWDIPSEASLERRAGFRPDSQSSIPSLRLLDWRIGYCLARWLATSHEPPLGRLVKKHIRCTYKLPSEPPSIARFSPIPEGGGSDGVGG